MMSMIDFIPNVLPWIWLGIVVVCLVIEAATLSLTTIWAAIAGIPLIFLSKTNLSLRWQLLIFVVLTFVLLISTRPLALKYFKKAKKNPNTLEGTEVLITKAIMPFEKGEAKTSNGVTWNARSKDNIQIEKDSRCTVSSVEGNTLIVELI